MESRQRNEWKRVAYCALAVGALLAASVVSAFARPAKGETDAAPKQASLMQRIQALEDTEQVRQLQYRYVNDLTFAQWDDVVNLFSDDAVLEVFVGREPIRGKAAIEKTFKGEIAKSSKHSGKEANIVVHPLITVTGDKAESNSVIYFITAYDPETDAPQKELHLLQGIYDARYSRVNGKWKISYLKWTPRLALPKPSADQLPPKPETQQK